MNATLGGVFGGGKRAPAKRPNRQSDLVARSTLLRLASLARNGNREAALAGLIQVGECELAGCEKMGRGTPRDPRDLSLAEIGISEKTVGYLSTPTMLGAARDAIEFPGALTAGDLLKWTCRELLAIHGFGVTSLNEVRRCLAGVRLYLRGDGLPYFPLSGSDLR